MTPRILLWFLLLFGGVPLFAAPVMESWETGYSGTDAIGAHVLGYWKFDGATPEEALRDLSGKGHDLRLEGGGRLNPTGKNGGAFESFPGFPVEDKRHAATSPNQKGLSVSGAFTLEMWIAPKPEFEARLRCFLLDKKYVDHTDYQWQIGDADKAGQRRTWVTIGFGAESRTVYSDAARFEPGKWRHVAFTYDGAGEGRFFIDGRTAGQQHHAGVAGPVPGTKPLSIGDRLGSNYAGFPGLIDEVRICQGVLAFEPVALTITSNRTVWRRMEKARPIEVSCTNLQRAALVGGTLHLEWTGGGNRETVTLPELAAGQTHLVEFPVNTSLRPDDYVFRARLDLSGTNPSSTERETRFSIVPRLPERMPVIMWGVGIGGVEKEADRLRDLGFTHCLGMGSDYAAIWKSGQETLPESPERVAENRRILDVALHHGLGLVANLSPGSWLETDPANLRIGRDGKPYPRQDICASIPALVPFFRNVGASVSKAYGDHPACVMGLVNSEVRDSSTPSFNPIDEDNYRAFSGGAIPAEVAYRGGVEWQKLKDFPVSRVIPDEDPILKYYRWFWTVGDGWNGLHSALHDGLKAHSGAEFRTFFDPAVRQPSIAGAGGRVDILSHWTYTYPDPQKIGLCADQLFAMAAAGGNHQEVMKMTQLIWYRSQTAPIGAAGATPKTPVAWEDHEPEAAYITIAPMHLREALWTKLARPIRGIMYHGWQSLVETDSPGAYRYTNPHTQHELKRLVHDVVEPLGPALLQIPDSPSEVAFFESFTSQMFARRGGYGSNLGWSADLWLALQHAHVQCDVIFEESLLKTALAGRRFLVMPECDVLTESIVKTITTWQQQGGKVIADENLCPGLRADLVLASFKRTKQAATDKATVLALAEQLGPKLESLGVNRTMDVDNPEIIVRTRHSGDADYVFAINDRRESGTYVGQHGLVMENGLPSRGNLIPRKGTGFHAYDLVAGVAIPPTQDGRIPLSLGPCDGRLIMLLPRPIGGIGITGPETAKAGETVSLSITVTDSSSAPLQAVIPARLEVRDANGRLAERSGFYGIRDGSLTVPLDLAPNEDPGMWEITVQELASRRSASVGLRVTP
ncbi:MAG: hypothetical protein IT576_07485 [Verrucomicrobiales bacterium]|nr:hypothetical protein [Verrucomicrobiales bacterium]